MIAIRCGKESAKVISASVGAVSVDWTTQIILLVFQFVRIRELLDNCVHKRCFDANELRLKRDRFDTD